MDHNLSIGAKVKDLRTAKKMTLKQLSEETGLSIGFLSQLERGLSSTAIESLAKIAACLDANLSDFFEFEKTRPDSPVCRSYEMHCTPISPQIIQYLPNGKALDFDCLPRIFDLMPYPGDELQGLQMNLHEGEEFVYVLEGILTIFANGTKYSLNPGDCMQIHSDTPHNWINETNRVVKILVINTPNPFKEGNEVVF